VTDDEHTPFLAAEWCSRILPWRGSYDFICLSNHFEAEYGWQITDTRTLRDEHFTTVVGAELSSAPWDERDAYWVTAAGLPLDFDAPSADERAESPSPRRTWISPPSAAPTATSPS
jgi:hypothetical protein